MTYEGHKNWNHWNVALWIGSDEGLYTMAMDHIKREHNLDLAAQAILSDLKAAGATHTPDGAPYSKSSIREAIRGLE
jgi:hypothetical protein